MSRIRPAVWRARISRWCVMCRVIAFCAPCRFIFPSKCGCMKSTPRAASSNAAARKCRWPWPMPGSSACMRQHVCAIRCCAMTGARTTPTAATAAVVATPASAGIAHWTSWPISCDAPRRNTVRWSRCWCRPMAMVRAAICSRCISGAITCSTCCMSTRTGAGGRSRCATRTAGKAITGAPSMSGVSMVRWVSRRRMRSGMMCWPTPRW